ESWGVGKWCSAPGNGCVGDGCVGDGCVGDGCVGDGCVAAAVVLSSECTNEGSGECEGEGSGEGEGEDSGEGEGEDVILEGEVEGAVTSSIVGNRATSWPENPFVGLFMLLK
ncbi:hypothetical protein Tco_0457439, partial [Tanacetum coccineum]